MPRALTLLVVVVSALGLLSFPIKFYDDSILLMGARLVAAGKIPYIDFYSNYGPFGYTLLSWLVSLFGNYGLAFRIGDIALLAVLAVLLHLLVHSLEPWSLLREYIVAPVVLAFSQAAMEPSFFGFAFAAAALVLFVLAQNTIRPVTAGLIAAAAGILLAVAAMTRPAFGIYAAAALLLIVVAIGRPSRGTLHNPILALAALFVAAFLTVALLFVFPYSRIPPGVFLRATVIGASRMMSEGSRFFSPDFLAGPIGMDIAAGASLAAMTVVWTLAVPLARVRKAAAACVAAGGLLPLWLHASRHPARDAGFLAMTFLGLAGAVAFVGRRQLRESAVLRASATFGIAAAAFGHYFWVRADAHHLTLFLSLALLGALLSLPLLRPLSRGFLLGVAVLAYTFALRSFSIPAAELTKPGVMASLRPWRCAVPPEDFRKAVSLADSLSEPRSRFVAVGTTQAWSSGNPIVLFLLSSRLPYTRWFQYDPGLQSSPAIQEEMERELDASGSQAAVVWKAGFYRWAGEDPRKFRSHFDDHFQRLYPVTLSRIGNVEVRVRRSPDSH